MADSYKAEGSLIRDYNKLSQEHKEKVWKYIKNLIRLQKAEKEVADKLYELKDYMTGRLQELEGVYINSRPGRESAPQIVSASFEGVRSEVLLHSLEERGIYVSSGSACSSRHPGVSGTLKGIGVRQDLLDATLRFSFGIFNTREEVDYAVDVLKELLPVLRRYK